MFDKTLCNHVLEFVLEKHFQTTFVDVSGLYTGSSEWILVETWLLRNKRNVFVQYVHMQELCNYQGCAVTRGMHQLSRVGMLASGQHQFVVKGKLKRIWHRRMCMHLCRAPPCAVHVPEPYTG